MSEATWLIITPGEPAGIGPDLILQYINSTSAKNIIVVADQDLLQQRAEKLHFEIPITDLTTDLPETDLLEKAQDKVLFIHHIPLSNQAKPGTLDKANANYVLACLDKAIELCTKYPNCALVTGPVHKGIINDAGISFSGHTEYLAEKANIELPVMMLATKGLRVALATTHLPLSDVCKAITQPLLKQVLTILHSDMQTKFHIQNPRITVCGLNPHAGESGHLGKEEITIIEPVLEELRKQGMDLIGPLPADTAFTQRQMQQSDAYLAMYHDQGLPVLKHVGFGKAVNITLGLPFIRTSVDHGTALELVGTGQADISSLEVAIETAQQMLASSKMELEARG